MRTFRRSRRAVDCRRKRSPRSMHHCITARQLETSPLRKRSPLSGRMCFFRKPCFIMFVFTWQNVCFFANRFYWQYLKGSQKGNHTFQDHASGFRFQEARECLSCEELRREERQEFQKFANTTVSFKAVANSGVCRSEQEARGSRPNPARNRATLMWVSLTDRTPVRSDAWE